MPTRYPTSAELEVLIALKDYHYLTVDQIMLVTGRVSLRSSQQRLKELADAGFVLKHDRRSSNVLHPLRAAWSLTYRSKRYLEGAQMIVLPPHRPRPYTLDHCLAVNDVLIRAQLVAREHPDVLELLEIHHDRALRTWNPPLSLVPDGFMHFAVTTAAGRESFPLLLELDMGTMDKRRWQEKIRRYLRFFSGEFQTVFGTDAATVTVVINDVPKRLIDLKRWTQQELHSLRRTEHADLFYLTLFEPALTGDELFLTSRFTRPFTETTAILLPVRSTAVIA